MLVPGCPSPLILDLNAENRRLREVSVGRLGSIPSTPCGAPLMEQRLEHFVLAIRGNRVAQGW